MENNVVHKPWGTYENILELPITKVKLIKIIPGESPSYQYHFKRKEMWVIIQGKAEVTIDDCISEKGYGDIIEVGIESKHSIKNVGEEDLLFIEIQLGEYFGEDDIVRVKDKYGRI